MKERNKDRLWEREREYVEDGESKTAKEMMSDMREKQIILKNERDRQRQAERETGGEGKRIRRRSRR